MSSPAAARLAADPVGIYIHVPFCAERCAYCHFDTSAGGVRGLTRYLDAVELDLRRSASGMSAAGPRAADSIYLGGGTPSLLPGSAVRRLLAVCAATFRVDPAAEVTLELNPEACHPAEFTELARAGVNRVSIGVQSLRAEALAAVGRRGRAIRLQEVVRRLRGAGITNLGFDLIAGLPGTSLDGFRSDLDRLLELQPAHLSVYPLELDWPTPLARRAAAGGMDLPDEDLVTDMLATAMERIPATGLRQYEIANYARPERESRHNLKYWRVLPVIGVGPSAWSTGPGEARGRVRGLQRYLRAVEAGAPLVEEESLLAPEAAAREAAWLGLRLREGISLPEVGARFGVDLAVRLTPALQRLAGDGLVEWAAPGRVRLSTAGVLLANEVFAALVS